MKRLFLAVLILVITQVAAPRGASEPPSTAPALLRAPHVESQYPSVAARLAGTGGYAVKVRVPARTVPAGGSLLTAVGTAPPGGTATWCAPTPRYCHGWGGNAHLGAVASFHYGDKPYLVTVRHGGRRTTVLVVSFCACHGSSRNIDLSPAAFRELSPLSAGRIDVTVSRGASAPATYTEGGIP